MHDNDSTSRRFSDLTPLENMLPKRLSGRSHTFFRRVYMNHTDNLAWINTFDLYFNHPDDLAGFFQYIAG